MSSCGKKKNTETVAQYRKRCGGRPLGMIQKVSEEHTCHDCGQPIDINEAGFKFVIRNKKKIKKLICPPGTKSKGRKKCVRMGSKERIKRAKGLKVTRRKAKGKLAKTLRKRAKSMKKRKGMGLSESLKLEELVGKPITEAQFDEAAGEKDACYRKVKARYDVWPSAYASGALVKCRKVGAKNWGNKSKKESVDEVKLNEIKMDMENFTDKLLDALQGDTVDLSFGIKHTNKIEKMWGDIMDVDFYYQVKDKKEMTKGLKKVKSHVAKIKSLNKSIFDKVLSDIDTAHKTFEVNIQKRIKISESKKVNEGDVVESYDIWNEDGSFGYTMTGLIEAEYQGRKVKLGKPMQGDTKKFKVYVKNDKGNVVKVNFGHGGSSAKGKTMKIRKSNPKARKSFRARHNCDNPGPRHKARYWSCRKW